MSETETNEDNLPEPKRLGLLAEYAGPDELISAAERATDDGYSRVEAFAPFAVLGIDEALKAKKTILPWIVLCCGLTGGTLALAMQCYMNGVEGAWWLSGYDYTISGKPSFSIPAFMPVTFEVIILLSSFGSFFGMILLNGLPKLSNPLFNNERFSRATSNGFFLYVESDDPKYAEAETSAYLTSIGAVAVEPIDEEVTGHAIPGVIHMVGAVVVTLAFVPPLWLLATSTTTWTTPRISWFKDMENQSKSKAQTMTPLFADGRAMRLDVPGTVARGSLNADIELNLGVSAEDAVAISPTRVQAQLVAFSDGETDAAAGEGDGAEGAEPPEPNWVDSFPLPVTAELMDRGEQRYNIYCATCHGLGGDGDGLITQRAMALEQGTWILPTNFYTEAVITQPNGKMFNTITNGIRNMPGYKSQISVEDRWAIVLYVRALQRSRMASADDLPAEKLNELSNLN